MKVEIAKKWVAALRSGEYKQGQGNLRNSDNTFCCLGVLCDLAQKEGILPEPEIREYAEYYKYEGAAYYTPPKVQEWAGLATVNGNLRRESEDVSYPQIEFIDRYGINKKSLDLAHANDTGATFATIADIIEANIEAL
jgi:hypothetical protein